MTIKATLQKWIGLEPSDSGSRLDKAIDEFGDSKQKSVEACKQTREAAVKARIATAIVARSK